ncbi:helix-turn-helix transcriptional regulator [Streptomyces axinellae]|uniref:Helix-turn-helix transcriptional regulator n=1 Tax=Streptomyces axinellae TaxID=552788 RepID=A0ABN3QC39_9ACTN
MSSCQPPTRRPAGLTASAMLAARLKEERESRGWSLTELAEKVRYDRADLHKMEQGQRLGSEYVIGRLEELYGTGDTLRTLRTLAKAEALRDKYQSYMDLEASASCLHEYAGGTVPGLLQTEAYAREQIRSNPANRSAAAIEELVAERIKRQVRLTADDAMFYRALLDEAIFIRRMSEPAAWVAQLDHLLALAQQPNITLQMTPIAAGVHDFVGANVFLMWHPGGDHTAYVESSKGGSVVEDSEDVADLRLSYDGIRDLSLSPRETRKFLQHLREEAAHGIGSSEPDRPHLAEVVLQRGRRGELRGGR